MGFALPGSIGLCCSRAAAERTICIDGDGGFQFNIQELETVARLQLPIKFFVLNNDGYASIRASQANYFGKASIGCDGRTGMTTSGYFACGRVRTVWRPRLLADQSNLRTESSPRARNIRTDTVCDVRVIPDDALRSARHPRCRNRTARWCPSRWKTSGRSWIVRNSCPTWLFVRSTNNHSVRLRYRSSLRPRPVRVRCCTTRRRKPGR